MIIIQLILFCLLFIGMVKFGVGNKGINGIFFYPNACLLFFRLMCATSLGKICASDHAMNAVEEMSALNWDIKQFFDENGADYPVWQALERHAGRYLE